MTAMMKIDLVSVHNHVPVTTTIAIAEHMQMPHASVIKLVRRWKADFEEFGLVGFEIRARLAGQWGGSSVEYAVLNEQQATLLFTYMRNTSKVRDTKKALVRAFFDARALLQSGCLSLLEQRAALSAVYESEKQQASVHGSGLNQWKHHKQGLQQAIHQINMQLQPLLTGWSE